MKRRTAERLALLVMAAAVLIVVASLAFGRDQKPLAEVVASGIRVVK